MLLIIWSQQGILQTMEFNIQTKIWKRSHAPELNCTFCYFADYVILNVKMRSNVLTVH
jgi:hypothetical protein